jgi:hypothetical protein
MKATETEVHKSGNAALTTESWEGTGQPGDGPAPAGFGNPPTSSSEELIPSTLASCRTHLST